MKLQKHVMHVVGFLRIRYLDYFYSYHIPHGMVSNVKSKLCNLLTKPKLWLGRVETPIKATRLRVRSPASTAKSS